MVAGAIGIVVPVLPGLLLIWAASAAWAFLERGGVAWVVLAITTMVYAAGLVAKYAIPGRRLRNGGVAPMLLVLAVLAGVVGFFVIPVVGAPLLFVGAIYAASWVRLRGHAPAWDATKRAVAAMGLSIGIELAAGLTIMTVWALGVVVAG